MLIKYMSTESRDILALTLPGSPPSTASFSYNGNVRYETEESLALLKLVKDTSKNTPTTGPVSLSIRYIRKNGGANPVEIIGGVVETLQGLAYQNISQVNEIFYTERHGDKEHYNISISLPELQIPAIFEPVGELGHIDANPAVFFPDDKASRWMLGLLLASEDIGVAMKIFAPYLMSPKVEEDAHRKYRTSHMLYFWRLWLAHIHEAWRAFNQNADLVVRNVKETSEVKEVVRKIKELRGRRVVGKMTAGDFMEKCRHTVFHYTEEDSDEWGERVKGLSPEFNVCITHGELKNVDARWLIADEYLLSRLSIAGLRDKELNEITRDLAIEIMNLIKKCQEAYFNEREPGFSK